MPTTEEPAGPDESETPDATRVSPTPNERHIDRGGIAVAATLLLACGAFVTYGVLDSDYDPADKRATTPTADVTYEVLGEGAATSPTAGPTTTRQTSSRTSACRGGRP